MTEGQTDGRTLNSPLARPIPAVCIARYANALVKIQAKLIIGLLVVMRLANIRQMAPMYEIQLLQGAPEKKLHKVYAPQIFKSKSELCGFSKMFRKKLFTRQRPVSKYG